MSRIPSKSAVSARGVHGPNESVGFLLSRLGLTSASRFHAALSRLELDPKQFHMLTLIAAREGQSQQQLAEEIRVPKSRMVSLVDDLERRGFVERRQNPDDRRQHALHLTRPGHDAAERGYEIALGHERQICKDLSATERRQLLKLLNKLVESEALDTPSYVHPGLADKT